MYFSISYAYYKNQQQIQRSVCPFHSKDLQICKQACLQVSFPISFTPILHTSLFFNMAPNAEKLPFKHLPQGIISHSHRPVQGDTFFMHSLGSFQEHILYQWFSKCGPWTPGEILIPCQEVQNSKTIFMAKLRHYLPFWP